MMSFDLSVIAVSFLIFFARLVDVSVGTLRIVCIAKGRKYLAPLLAFIEISIWLLAIRQVMVSNFVISHFIAYAAGFALGNFMGLLIEERLALGKISVRIITRKDATNLISELKENDFGVTALTASGSSGNVKLIFTVVNRKDLKKVKYIIRKNNPKAFLSVQDVQFASEGSFQYEVKQRKGLFDFKFMSRKAK